MSFLLIKLRHLTLNLWNAVLATILIALSIFALVINAKYYQFKGINYFPAQSISMGLSLALILWGVYLTAGKASVLYKTLQYVISFFLVMCLLALATNAVQLTPFPPIDVRIIAIEESHNINLVKLFSWIKNFPALNHLLDLIYASLSFQMAIIPLIAIFLQKYSKVEEYFFFLLLTTLLGFAFYYFYPTTAPASNVDNALFSAAQKNTGIKFFQIHHYINPTSIDGGMIAFPSFHVIWAWYCCFIIRQWKYIFFTLLSINSLLVAACVLLGWHYLLDILGSIILILFAHVCLWLINYSNRRSNLYMLK
jgi:hypothetical protein